MSTIGIDAYPLCWPEGWKRTKSVFRESSKFKSTFAVARDELIAEIGRLRGRFHKGPNPVISTNVALRRDGLPYANQREPEDSGVAVYFEYKNKPMAFACDKYKKVWENFVAIRKTIEAIRGIERWGASDMMERAFSGFVSLPDLSDNNWWETLGVKQNAEYADVKYAYQKTRSIAHRSNNGELLGQLKSAWKKYIAEKGET